MAKVNNIDDLKKRKETILENVINIKQQKKSEEKIENMNSTCDVTEALLDAYFDNEYTYKDENILIVKNIMDKLLSIQNESNEERTSIVRTIENGLHEIEKINDPDVKEGGKKLLNIFNYKFKIENALSLLDELRENYEKKSGLGIIELYNISDAISDEEVIPRYNKFEENKGSFDQNTIKKVEQSIKVLNVLNSKPEWNNLKRIRTELSKNLEEMQNGCAELCSGVHFRHYSDYINDCNATTRHINDRSRKSIPNNEILRYYATYLYHDCMPKYYEQLNHDCDVAIRSYEDSIAKIDKNMKMMIIALELNLNIDVNKIKTTSEFENEIKKAYPNLSEEQNRIIEKIWESRNPKMPEERVKWSFVDIYGECNIYLRLFGELDKEKLNRTYKIFTEKMESQINDIKKFCNFYIEYIKKIPKNNLQEFYNNIELFNNKLVEAKKYVNEVISVINTNVELQHKIIDDNSENKINVEKIENDDNIENKKRKIDSFVKAQKRFMPDTIKECSIISDSVMEFLRSFTNFDPQYRFEGVQRQIASENKKTERTNTRGHGGQGPA